MTPFVASFFVNVAAVGIPAVLEWDGQDEQCSEQRPDAAFVYVRSVPRTIIRRSGNCCRGTATRADSQVVERASPIPGAARFDRLPRRHQLFTTMSDLADRVCLPSKWL